MANVTYYVVLPFMRDEEGNLCPEPPIECHSASGACSRARTVASSKSGAVAFSRSGDPEAGEFADAVILARLGDVPADLEAVSG